MCSSFIDFLVRLEPGEVSHGKESCQVLHNSGDVSTLWLKNPEFSGEPRLARISEFFSDFDGADLFSSTFKVASLFGDRVVNGNSIVGSFEDLRLLARKEHALSDEALIPFMTEAGVWLYLFDPVSSCIRKWDLEYHEECDSYATLESIIEEWFSAVRAVD